MGNWTRERLNPIETIKMLWGLSDEQISHIKYDPKMSKGQYNINRQTSHDGTLFFTVETMGRVLDRIVNMQSYFTLNPPNDTVELKYVIGPIKVMTVFGKVDVNGRNISGQRELMSMPVICEHVK